MNWDQIEGNWKHMTGEARARWAKLTDDDIAFIAGKREALAGKIQERYGLARDEAEKQLLQWQRRASELGFGRLPRQNADRPPVTPVTSVGPAADASNAGASPPP